MNRFFKLLIVVNTIIVLNMFVRLELGDYTNYECCTNHDIARERMVNTSLITDGFKRIDKKIENNTYYTYELYSKIKTIKDTNDIVDRFSRENYDNNNTLNRVLNSVQYIESKL